jgi:F-type H+-transporting ATPase subunit b
MLNCKDGRTSRRLNKLVLGLVMAVVFSVVIVSPVMAEEAKSNVMPPLSGEGSEQTYAQAVWVMIIFVILLAILYPTAWKNVLGGLNKREEKIRGAIAEADAARAKGEETLKEYNAQLATAATQVRELLSQAAIDAEKIAAGIKTHAQQEAEELKEKAIKEIEYTKRQALTEIYEQSADLATSIAEKILKRNLNQADQRELVKQSLDELQAVHV